MKKEEILAAYIEKVLNTQDEILSESHLKAVAFELGLDEAAYQELQEVYEMHLIRGKAFVSDGNWEEAISEFRHAIDLNPLKTEALMAMSSTYESFWQESGKKVYKEEALFYAKRALKFDPDLKEGIESIGRIQEREERKSSRVRGYALVLVGLLLGVLLITYQVMDEFEGEKPIAYLEIQDSLQEGSRIHEFKELEVPIRFKTPVDHRFKFHPTLSKLHDRKKNYSLDIQGLIEVSRDEISKLGFEISMIMEDSSLWNSEKFSVFNSSMPARVGDRIPFGRILFEDRPLTKDLSHVEISVSEISVAIAADSYPPSQAIPSIYMETPPKGVALELKLRTYEYKQYGEYPYVYIAIEGTNRGERPLTVLMYEIDLLDKAGASLFQDQQYALTSGEPPLQPGDTYVSWRLYGLSKIDWKSIDRLEVRIAEARPEK